MENTFYVNSEKSRAADLFGFMLGFIILTATLVISCVALSLYLPKSVETDSDGVLSGVGYSTYPTVVIDPGHGGADGGAEANGVVEKEINLKISLYLRDFLELAGVNALLTREDDTMLALSGERGASGSKKRNDLLARVEMAEKCDNAVFVSVHQNKFPVEKYNGLQVYYSTNNPGSKKLAESVRNTSKRYVQPDNNREAKGAGSSILVLNKLEMPAVLVECGFLSNRNEASLLATEAYQKKLAFAIFLGIKEYIDNR